MTKPHYWDEAKAHLARDDRRLAKIIADYKGEALTSRGDAFHTLARAIVGQQISVKAADTVWTLFEKATSANPQKIIAAKEDALKECGLSAQKVKYLKNISEFMLSHNGKWHESDEEVIKQLCSINGVGRWTAEMFLIFHLQRPDVLPLADIGLQNAIEKVYGGDADPKKVSEKWRPYRTVATWYLWRSLDPVPVAY